MAGERIVQVAVAGAGKAAEVRRNQHGLTDASPLFDLHVHSIRSDGELSLMQLANLARRSGLAGLALTDHDALPDATALGHAARQAGVALFAGVELSVQFANRRVHLIGYGFDPMAPGLVELCRDLQAQRRRRFDALADRLRRQNIVVDRDRAGNYGSSIALGRLHLARELVRSRWAPTPSAAFVKFLKDIDAPTQLNGPDLVHAVREIHAAGGRAVLAHPPAGFTVDIWRGFAEAGLDGIEVRFPGVTNRHRQFLTERITEYGWIETAGSDYHGWRTTNYLGMHTVGPDVVEQLFRPHSG
jgi:predicted metal-dependent phosphoesterase TrpH